MGHSVKGCLDGPGQFQLHRVHLGPVEASGVVLAAHIGTEWDDIFRKYTGLGLDLKIFYANVVAIGF